MKRLTPTLSLVLGLVLGATATFAGLRLGGQLVSSPARPDLLLTLGQTLDVEHQRIDLLIDKGDVGAAIDALEALRAGPWPSRADAGETAAILRHDVYGRLLRLRLDNPTVASKSPAELLAIADEGLGPAPMSVEKNAFTARLIAIRGEILEALGRDEEALGAYEQALDINRALLQAALRGEGT